jgi:Ser/Thr protein kinase RdoA (MazF antagonist)
MKPSQAAQRFSIGGRLVYTDAIGRGNVNDTYEAMFRAGASVEQVILQRINSRVFVHPEWIMANMRVVTDHLQRRVEVESATAIREWAFPRIIQTREGADYLVDEDGRYWRAMTRIERATSYEKVRDAEHALETGTVIGCFHRLIADLDPSRFLDTLPGFHVCPGYLERYDRTVGAGVKEGRSEPAEEIARLARFVDRRRGLAGVLEDAVKAGELERRLIHGDPKVDNIMVDDFTGKGIGIIDLDTVKPGLIHYDVGDALRSVCNPAGEDAANLNDVVFDVGLCEAFMNGYMSQARDFLTDADRAHLYDAIRLLPFELGLRFFEDYLAGDVYFKVKFEEHNLNRARVQFKLCESIEINERAVRAALAPKG